MTASPAPCRSARGRRRPSERDRVERSTAVSNGSAQRREWRGGVCYVPSATGSIRSPVGRRRLPLIVKGSPVLATAPPDVSVAAEEKYGRLGDLLVGLESVLVAFSGGVDSTLLLFAARQALGGKALAASGLSETYSAEEMEEARQVAAEIGAEYVVVTTMELTDPRYANNSHQRCFFCKSELYGKLAEVARARGLAQVVDGSNADDLDDFRPGMRAARDLGVRSPLQEVGLTKDEIRALAAKFQLRTWDKPAAACLSSRFAYGDPITVEKLRRVAAAERALRDLGLRGFRVRHHDAVARIELPREQMANAVARADELSAAVKATGYRYVSLDLDGYRAGSANEVLNAGLQPGGLRRPRPL